MAVGKKGVVFPLVAVTVVHGVAASRCACNNTRILTVSVVLNKVQEKLVYFIFKIHIHVP